MTVLNVAKGQEVSLTTSTHQGSRSGPLTDPDTLELRVLAPDGTVTVFYWPSGSPAITRDAQGVFRAAIVGSIVGDWIWRYVSTGAVAAADFDQTFNVAPTRLP